jgi:branched-chain amino acid transport system substrate-binding protein
MVKIVTLACVVLALLSVVGCERQVEIAPSGKIIRLGVIGPFSGDDRAKGEDGVSGIKTAMKWQPLLKNGDRIELIIEDDQNKPELTINALNRLANDERVSAVLLMSTSSSALKIKPQANKLEIPVLAMLATHPDVSGDNDYVSQLCFDDIFQGSVAALFVMDELLIEKVAVFTDPDNEHSSVLATEFIRKFQTVGGVVTETVMVDGDESYQDKLQAMRDKGTELLYLPVKPKDVVAIKNAARKIDWQPEVMASDGLVATIINDYADDAALLEDIYAIDFFSTDDKDLQKSSYSEKIMRLYYSTRDADKATSYTALGVESYLVIKNAMNHCDKPGDRICLNRMLRETKNFEGLVGKISILENGKAERPLIVNKISGGELLFVVKVY